MTIFSLGSACDLEHFSNNTKLSPENLERNDYGSPVVPMPTDPPTFNNTNYTWPSESSAVRDMTTRRPNSNTFQPSVGADSQDFGSVNFGPDYWGENTDKYSFSNKLLNNNLNNNKFQSDSVVMPGMKPQGAYMPPARTHIVNNEDMNGRELKRRIKKVVMPKVEEVIEDDIPDFDVDKVEKDTKNLWFFLIILLIVVVGFVMYKANYF